SAYLDESKTFKIYWKINNEKKSIQFAARVKTLGWVGFGISSGNGNMIGSDVIIGWVKENTGYLKDRYADAKALPPIDAKQDYTLVAAREDNGETIIEFSRLWNTCDEKDNKIEEGTVRVVYAYHTNDPTSEENIPQHSVRGAASLVLLNVFTSKPSIPQNTPHFDLRQNDTVVPDSDTTYFCKSYEFPQYSTKKHVIKIEPVISSGNDRVVHHMLVYECNRDFPRSNLSVNGPCYASNMPPAVQECTGSSVIASWGIGGGPFYFPNHTGFAIGAGVGPRYVILEIHYDNPQRKSGIKDSSGLRFYYTDSLRQYDAGILWAGWNVEFAMMIPPYQQQWMTTGYCSGMCTKIVSYRKEYQKHLQIYLAKLDVPTIYLIGLGTALKTRHVRDGKELPEIARDDYYDFNYQEFHISRKETHIAPGDDIIVDCQYQSKDKTRPVTGGLKSSEEMCMSFLYYYPKVELNKCLSADYGMYPFFRKHFNVNGSTVGYPPAQWTQNLTNELKESYDKNPYIRLKCVYQAEVKSPVYNNYTLKPIVNVPYTKEGDNCPTAIPSTTKPVGEPSAAGLQTVEMFGATLAAFVALVLNAF
ncbi:DBH-like monooxygenase protein 1 homolog, partial [Actinia tenebrosa]|uniref:DBH-like monooxygenase protein 1 homolog n=1 Tax=Actinia tenebrosa TaxID=6105 RepID=A0A6P8J5S0_ACTTE